VTDFGEVMCVPHFALGQLVLRCAGQLGLTGRSAARNCCVARYSRGRPSAMGLRPESDSQAQM
jgi:hypothetical protein